jgi:hypothetical protein
MAAAYAVIGKSRNRSISFMGLLSEKTDQADMNRHGPGFEEY